LALNQVPLAEVATSVGNAVYWLDIVYVIARFESTNYQRSIFL
jgi:hypothetical protein